MRFSQIPGLSDVKAPLLHSAASGHVAHAQLFAGPDGGAALPLALAYATRLNCETPAEDGDSCGRCPACSKMDKLVHPDLHFVLPLLESKLDDEERNERLTRFRAFFLAEPFGSYRDWLDELRAENKQGTISAEAARQLPMKAAMAAYEAPQKIFVLWLPELLHPTAANALLKLLEEPPAHTIFLLVTQNPGALLPTIVSRTQRVTVRAHTEAELQEFLVSRHHLAPPAAEAAAQLAEGAIRAAIDAVGTADTDYFDFFRNWLRLCWAQKWQELLDTTSEDFQKRGREGQKNLLRYGLGFVRKVLLHGLDPALVPTLPPNEAETVGRMSRLITPLNAPAIVALLTDAIFHTERNANPKLVFFDTSLSLYPLLKA